MNITKCIISFCFLHNIGTRTTGSEVHAHKVHLQDELWFRLIPNLHKKLTLDWSQLLALPCNLVFP